MPDDLSSDTMAARKARRHNPQLAGLTDEQIKQQRVLPAKKKGRARRWRQKLQRRAQALVKNARETAKVLGGSSG